MCKYCTARELEEHYSLVTESNDYRKGYLFALKTMYNMTAGYIVEEVTATEFFAKKAEGK